MRWLLVVLIVLIAQLPLSGGLAAEKPAEPKPGSSETEKVETQPPPVQKNDSKQPQPKWPRPYKPSEEISADSTVPFPTDI